MGMRIVAGTARGRKIDAPDGRGTRPTTDRVREAIFNALHSLDLIEGATVVDLFAGSGALGLEALSRGADSCLFVDSDRRAVQTVNANLGRLGLADRATVRQADGTGAIRAGERFDLALLDPPYPFDGWQELLGTLPANFAVIESDRAVELPDAWETVRTRSYGTTVVLFARNVRGPAPE